MDFISKLQRKSKSTTYLENLHFYLGTSFLQSVLKKLNTNIWYLIYVKNLFRADISLFLSIFRKFNEPEVIFNFLNLDILDDDWVINSIMGKISKSINEKLLNQAEREFRRNFQENWLFLYLIEASKNKTRENFLKKYQKKFSELNINTEKALKYAIEKEWNNFRLQVANYFLQDINEKVETLEDFDIKLSSRDIRRKFSKLQIKYVKEKLFLPTSLLKKIIVYSVPEIPEGFELQVKSSNVYVDFIHQVSSYGDIEEYLQLVEPIFKKRELYFFQLP